jgi:hypothetical protein
LTLSVFANCSLFRIGTSDGIIFFEDMRLKDEFSFAPAEQIHRIRTSPQTSNQSQTLHRLNEAHPDLDFDPFLAWRLRFVGTHVG